MITKCQYPEFLYRTLQYPDVCPPFQMFNFYSSRLDLTFFPVCVFFCFLRLNHLSSIVVGFLPQTSSSFPIYFLVRTIFWRWRRRLVRWRNCNILKYSYFDSFLGYHFSWKNQEKTHNFLVLGSSFVFIWNQTKKTERVNKK